MKTLIRYFIFLSFAIAPLAVAEEQQFELNSQAASYQNGTQQTWSEYLASWSAWATEQASLIKLIGAQGVKALLNGIWSLAKDYAVGEVSKYASDLLYITAGQIIANYFQLGYLGGGLTTIAIKALSRQIVNNVRVKMAEIGKPITEQVAQKAEDMLNDILAIPK